MTSPTAPQVPTERREEIDALWIDHEAGRRSEGFWRFISALDAQSAEHTRADVEKMSDLDALEAKLQAATEEPWVLTAEDTFIQTAAGVAIAGVYGSSETGLARMQLNASAIVALRNAAPALIAAARREAVICDSEDTPVHIGRDLSPEQIDRMFHGIRAHRNQMQRERAQFRSDLRHAREGLEVAARERATLLDDLPWRCFQCDGVFTRAEEAKEHFGSTLCVTTARAEIVPLREALEAAEEALQRLLPEFTPHRRRIDATEPVLRNTHSALAKVRAALGRESASPAVKAKGE